MEANLSSTFCSASSSSSAELAAGARRGEAAGGEASRRPKADASLLKADVDPNLGDLVGEDVIPEPMVIPEGALKVANSETTFRGGEVGGLTERAERDGKGG